MGPWGKKIKRGERGNKKLGVKRRQNCEIKSEKGKIEDTV
jgi:hypothetical protein